MTDLLQVLVDFPTAQFSHLLPSLDKALITTSDLLTLDAVDVAKRAQLPPAEVVKLTDAILKALHAQLNKGDALGVESEKGAGEDDQECRADGEEDAIRCGMREWSSISTLDDKIDEALGGGIPTGYVTEITGERYVLSSSPSLRLSTDNNPPVAPGKRNSS